MGTATDPYQHCEALQADAWRRRGARRLREPDVDADEVDADRPRRRCLPTAGASHRRERGDERRHARRGRAARGRTGHAAGGKRLEILRRFADAGIRTGVLVAPILPGLTDDEDHVDEVLAACAEAGVSFATGILLHVRPGIRDHFMPWMKRTYPWLYPRYVELYGKRAYVPKEYQEQVSERSRACGSGTGSGLGAAGRRGHALPGSLRSRSEPSSSFRRPRNGRTTRSPLSRSTRHVARPAAGAPADDDDDLPAAPDRSSRPRRDGTRVSAHRGRVATPRTKRRQQMGHIRDLMTSNPTTCEPSTTVLEAARRMAQDDVGSIPVVEGDRLVGLLTDRDITVRVVAEGRDPMSTTLATWPRGSSRPCRLTTTSTRRFARWRRRRCVVSRSSKATGSWASSPRPTSPGRARTRRPARSSSRSRGSA